MSEWKGILDSVQRSRRNQSDIDFVEVTETGDYLAFISDGDPVYLPREIMDWMEERQEPESFLKKLKRQLSKI